MESKTEDTTGSEPTKIPPKPRAEVIRPEITRLARLTFARRLFRKVFGVFLRLLLFLVVDLDIRGTENIPKEGAAIAVINHLGDIDPLLGMAYTPRYDVEVLMKAELRDIPIVGALMNAYGVIWVHRGQPDRRAIRAALQALKENRMIALAPEGRESVIDGLEEGTHGAAYLALKADVPLVPTTFTGTENTKIFSNLKRLRRTKVTMTTGAPFTLEKGPNIRASLEPCTRQIMLSLAQQLPKEYRGIYAEQVEGDNGC